MQENEYINLVFPSCSQSLDLIIWLALDDPFKSQILRNLRPLFLRILLLLLLLLLAVLVVVEVIVVVFGACFHT